MRLIDWVSQESYFFANPSLSSDFFPIRWTRFTEFSSHIWIATSGTTQAAKNAIKWVALSKKAFLASAEAVNAHLQSNSEDRWLNALPLFHVGGLSIFARAHLSGATVVQAGWTKWSPHGFMRELSSITLTSLVPAQLFDLVQAGYEASPDLRGVVIGGGNVTDQLYQKARSLKWPILPSFGMTECCSQVATARFGDPSLILLSHVECSLSPERLLQIKSPALLTGYLHVKGTEFQWEDPKKNGVFTTEDVVEIKEGKLQFLGRKNAWIKIGGENVSLFHLDTYFNQVKPLEVDAYLKAAVDERLGNIIQLVTLTKHRDQTESLIEKFNHGVMPYEKIRSVQYVEFIPRTPLGKIYER